MMSDPLPLLNDSYFILVGDFDMLLGDGMFILIFEAFLFKDLFSGALAGVG